MNELSALTEQAGIRIISIHDAEYPAGLKQLPDAPHILYVMGQIAPSDNQSIAIIGTRNASIYGKNMAEAFGEDCSSQNVTIVSGLARGIDTAAHEGALKGGRTIAVIGSGFGHLYPKENLELAKRIAKNGALISEYPFNTPPNKFRFPRRNRLIAALSWGCLLIEGAEKSGGMITIDWALKLKKPCFTLPGKADMESFKGNRHLINTGKARLVENAEEMLSLLEPPRQRISTLRFN